MSQALELEGFAAAAVPTLPTLPRLPYYGEILTGHTQPVRSAGGCAEDERRWGRIPNPTIHIALNQLRRLVNDLMDAYGRPSSFVVETTRSLKLGAEQLRSLASRQAGQERDNRRYDEMAKQALGPAAGSTRRDRRLRLMLWERQGQMCMYSLQDRVISLAAALSDEYEIDHVLPFAKTLDDSAANKVLVAKRWNQLKRDRAPWDAFPEEQREAIRERAERLYAQNRRKGFPKELMRRLGPEGPLTALHTASARQENLPEVFVPITGFEDRARNLVDAIVVSHRRDRGTARSLVGLGSTSTTGEMHDETNRPPAGAEAAGLKVIRHRRADGVVLSKAVKTNGNAYLEIYRRAEGSTGGELVSTFDANRMETTLDGRRRPYQPRWVREHKQAHLVTRLFIGDTVAMRGDDGGEEYWVVKQIVDKSPAPVIRLVRHSVALPYAEAERRKSGLACERRPSAIDKYSLRLVHVDPLGRVNVGRKRWNASSTSRGAEPRSV